jgi:hypothetical protein
VKFVENSSAMDRRAVADKKSMTSSR